jgi:hypothetical protein
MSKNKKLASQDDFEAELKSEVQVFDSLALGIIKTGTGYAIIKVPIDTKNLEAGALEILDTAENKWEANEKFKITVIKQGVM